MKTYLLLLHGNGGARARFQLLFNYQDYFSPGYEMVVPALPGFEGRPYIYDHEDQWRPFLKALGEVVKKKGASVPWIVYGHGIGGSMLMEWASRNWEIEGVQGWRPKHVILHGCIGASLHKRWFPALMRPFWLRQWLQILVSNPKLQPVWERKLFLHPKAIPVSLKKQFFQDYRECAAFPYFFDMITISWYREVQSRIGDRPFYFLWGDQERVVASTHLPLWKAGFPNSTFDIHNGWDHFPMLEDASTFARKLRTIMEELDHR